MKHLVNRIFFFTNFGIWFIRKKVFLGILKKLYNFYSQTKGWNCHIS